MSEILFVGGSAAIMQLMYLVQQTALYKLTSMYGGDEQLVLIGVVALTILMFTFIPILGIKGTWLSSSVTDAIVFVLSIVPLAMEFKKLNNINYSENQNITYVK